MGTGKATLGQGGPVVVRHCEPSIQKAPDRLSLALHSLPNPTSGLVDHGPHLLGLLVAFNLFLRLKYPTVNVAVMVWKGTTGSHFRCWVSSWCCYFVR